MSSFPATAVQDVEASPPEEYAVSVASGETAAAAGELMYFDTSTQTIKRCGADPSLIAGIFEAGNSANARLLTPNNKVPLRVLTPRTGVRMCSATTLAETNVGVAYGIVRDSAGNWAIDTTDTSNTRVFVYRVDLATNAGYVRFMAGNLQFDAIAS